MDLQQLFNDLGTDIEKWCQILGEMKLAQSMFASADGEKSFGPILIKYSNIKKEVNEKFNFCIENTLVSLRQKLYELGKRFINDACDARNQLEATSFQMSTMKE